jgi:hypothetical protein
VRSEALSEFPLGGGAADARDKFCRIDSVVDGTASGQRALPWVREHVRRLGWARWAAKWRRLGPISETGGRFDRAPDRAALLL